MNPFSYPYEGYPVYPSEAVGWDDFVEEVFVDPVIDYGCPDGYELDDWGNCVPEVQRVFVIEREILYLYPELIVQYPDLNLHPEWIYRYRPELRTRYAGIKSVGELRNRFTQVHHTAPPARPKTAPPATPAKGAKGGGGHGQHGGSAQQSSASHAAQTRSPQMSAQTSPPPPRTPSMTASTPTSPSPRTPPPSGSSQTQPQTPPPPAHVGWDPYSYDGYGYDPYVGQDYAGGFTDDLYLLATPPTALYKAQRDIRGLFGDDSSKDRGSDGGRHHGHHSDWSGVTKVAIGVGVVVGAYFLYRSVRGGARVSASAIRGGVAGASES